MFGSYNENIMRIEMIKEIKFNRNKLFYVYLNIKIKICWEKYVRFSFLFGGIQKDPCGFMAHREKKR